MEEKLERLYEECIQELEGAGLKILDNDEIGEIDIHIAKRNNKRYACCKQENPNSKYYHIKNHKIVYDSFDKHHIEVSRWVMDLEEKLIKNTIFHEIIHCFPFCNNHGKTFKKYAKWIEDKLGYSIQTVGNKEEDYAKSNLIYQKEEEKYLYQIACQKCGIIIYRKRLRKDFIKKYRCGKCGGKLKLC